MTFPSGLMTSLGLNIQITINVTYDNAIASIINTRGERVHKIRNKKKGNKIVNIDQDSYLM